MKAVEIGAKKTIVFYLHGLRGHALSQKRALEHVVKNVGVTLISLELPGHGPASQQEHCMVPRFPKLVDEIVNEVRGWGTDAEQVVLMGYSFGGALMTLAAHRLEQDQDFKPKVAGLVGISTAFEVSHNVPRWQLSIAGLIAPLSRLFYKRFPRGSRWLTIGEMKIERISPDLGVQRAIREDDWTYKGRIPLNTSAQVYRASKVAKQTVDKLLCDVLLIHSLDDQIAKPPTQKSFKKAVALKLFKNLRHNCIDGTLREAVLARRAMTEFLVAKL